MNNQLTDIELSTAIIFEYMHKNKLNYLSTFDTNVSYLLRRCGLVNTINKFDKIACNLNLKRVSYTDNITVYHR